MACSFTLKDGEDLTGRDLARDVARRTRGKHGRHGDKREVDKPLELSDVPFLGEQTIGELFV